MFPEWLSAGRDIGETLSATRVKKFAKEMGLQKGTSNLRLLQTYLKSNPDSSTREDTENSEHEGDTEDVFDAGDSEQQDFATWQRNWLRTNATEL